MVTITIIDEPKARTRRKTFNYAREGSILRHISKYAVRAVREGDKRAWKIYYEIPYERIADKWIYELGFTNSGGFTAFKYWAGDFLHGKPTYIGVSDDEFYELEIEVQSP